MRYKRRIVLALFRKNHFAYSLLMLPYALFLRILPVFDSAPTPFAAKGLLTSWFFGTGDTQSIWMMLCAILLLFIQGAMINRIVIRNRITYEMSLFPGVFLILVCSLFPTYANLSSILIANTFVLIALEDLFSAHKKTKSALRIFNVGFWLSVSGLWYFGYTHFFFLGLVGLSALRTLWPKEWLQYITGYATPILLMCMLDYLIHGSLSDVHAHFTQHLGFFAFISSWNWISYAEFFLFGVLILISLLSINHYLLRKNIHAQKKVEFMYWMLLFGGLVFFIQNRIFHEEWLVIGIPLAIFLSIQFLNFNNPRKAEFLHIVLLLFVFTLQILMLIPA